MEVNMVKLQSETRLAEKKQFTKSNLLSEFMCKGYRNADLVNAKGNDVALSHGYDNLA